MDVDLQALSKVVRNLPAGAVLRHGDRLVCNLGVERITGYGAAELSSLAEWFQTLYGERAAEARAAYEAGRAAGFPETRTVSMRHKDGHIAWVEVTGHLGDQAEVWFLHDITRRRQAEEERRQLEQRLAHAQRMEAVGILAGGIAHDFNNILGAVMGYTELSLMKLGQDSPVRGYLKEVIGATDRARVVVQQILAFSRQAEEQRRPVLVLPLIKEVLKLLRATIPSTIEIGEDLDPACGEVLADPSQLHQVVMNLCTNAYQAMRDSGGEMIVGLRQVKLAVPGEPAEREYLQISVQDTGVGMPAAVRERVFEPYFTTRETGGGTGLGLAVVHGIVTGLGGSIAVESLPGAGSTFRVYLPQAPKATEATVSGGDWVRGAGERVLFVDDEPALANLGQRLLETLGYQVTATTSSVDALERFRAAPDQFDCVVTDQTLPQLTGAELSRELLALRPELPVIICTGYSETLDEEQARELGVRAFLLKPLRLQSLAATVAGVLGAEKVIPGGRLDS